MKKILILLMLFIYSFGFAQSRTAVTLWRTGKTYQIDELVAVSGVIYRALNSNSTMPPSADWAAAQSSAGAEADPIYLAWDKDYNDLINKPTFSQIDQAGVIALGFVTGAHTTDTDTQLSQAQVGTFATAEGFIKSGEAETDPVFIAWNKSTGISITESQISDLSHTTDTNTQLDQTGVEALGFVTGAHTTDTNTQLDVAGVIALGFVTGAHTTDTNTQLSQANVGTFATAEGFIKTFSEADPNYVASQASNITAQHITDLGNLSGTNSGDQDISGIGTNTTAIALNTAKTGITTQQATDITTNNAKVSFDSTSSTRLANTSGTNTGDQVLTGYALKNELDVVTNSNVAITISAGDYGTVIYCTGTSAITVTIPDTLTPVNGQIFAVVQWSAFQVSIVGSGTTTIKSTSATEKTLEEASAIQFIHIGTDSDDWHAVGSLEDN